MVFSCLQEFTLDCFVSVCMFASNERKLMTRQTIKYEEYDDSVPTLCHCTPCNIVHVHFCCTFNTIACFAATHNRHWHIVYITLIVSLSFNTLTIRIFSFAFVKSFDFFEPFSDKSECCESGVGRMQKFRTDEIRSCKDMKVRGNFVRII